MVGSDCDFITGTLLASRETQGNREKFWHDSRFWGLDLNPIPSPYEAGILFIQRRPMRSSVFGTRTWEYLRWRGPTAIVNIRLVLSSERCYIWPITGCVQDELIGGKLPVVNYNFDYDCCCSQIGTRSVDWAQLSRFQLKMETKSSLLKAVF
jgi:hypothetical protein